MGDFLIPANAKRGKLILGYFRPVDLIIFGIGMTTALILLFIFQKYMDNVWISVLLLSPGLISLFLVLPIPNQHNILVLLTAIYKFYFVNRNIYMWKGWVEQNGDK